MANSNEISDDRIALYESLIDFSDDAIITKTLDGIITSWNKAAEVLFGFTQEEIIGKHISIIIPKQRLSEEEEIIVKIKAGEYVKHYETERLRKDGSTFYISLTISPLKNKEGTIFGASKIARDITKRKKEEHHLKLLESVITNTTDAVLITEASPLDEPGPRIIYVNEAFSKMTGYSADEVVGKSPRLLQGTKSDVQELRRLSEALREHKPCEITTINYKKNGEPFWVNFSVDPVADETGKYTHFIAIERDVTLRKNEELQKLLMSELSLIFNENNLLENALSFACERLVNFSTFSAAAFWLIDPDNTGITLVSAYAQSPEMQTFFDHKTKIKTLQKGKGLPGVIWETKQIQFWGQVENEERFIRKDAAKNAGINAVYGLPLCYNNDMIGVLVLALDTNEKPDGIPDNLLENIGIHLGADIARKKIDIARKNAEAASIGALRERNIILESIDDAFFAVDRNWVVTYWNRKAERVLSRVKDEMLGRNLWDVYVDSIDSESYKKYHVAMDTNQVVHFEDYYPPLHKWYEISAYPSDSGLSVYFKDVTDRKVTDAQLKEVNGNLSKRTKELEISNAELEQFAYVASHDLQEPLRMITSFLSQLEKKYSDIIDDKGKKYIYFAVDGAKRMRQIILDLLEFSRVGRTEEDTEEVNLTMLVNDILSLFRKQIEESGAVISTAHLPTLQINKSPIRQVFQNLISNSLKYQKSGVAPVITISCEDTVRSWQFSVKDNGIGIDAEYFDKIFIIFQRLHQKEEYSGTGMGLAIAKKIVENMGGKIWVESEEGKGSTFYFSIFKKYGNEVNKHSADRR